ncbi:MAG: hypothetical protein M3464_06055 [Chloroflexota bacterium]|nr:hypothetical protein [Chloroflexota bacterium]
MAMVDCHRTLTPVIGLTDTEIEIVLDACDHHMVELVSKRRFYSWLGTEADREYWARRALLLRLVVAKLRGELPPEYEETGT